MSDMISRQAAIDAINEIIRMEHSLRPKVYVAKDAIKALPSADPQIIRCKDCKHYKFADNRAFGFPVKRCEWTGFEDVDDDDFCSMAERKE